MIRWREEVDVRNRFFISTVGSAAVMIFVASFTPVAAGGGGQEGATARKTSVPSRTADGRPDLQGTWTPSIGGHTFEEGPDPANSLVQGDAPPQAGRPDVIVDPAPDGRIPYQPWAAEKRNDNLRNIFAPTRREHVEPEDRCMPSGVPRSNLRGQLQITQGPGYVLLAYEWIHAYRYIPLDGRPHVAQNVQLWNGDSRGRWEGDTLVVDVTNFAVDAQNFNNQPWLDGHGSFYTDALHVVERWTLADANTINYRATIEDPKVFTRPWTIAFTINRNMNKNYEFIEVACIEGYKNDVAIGAGRAAKAAGQTGIHEHTKGFYGGK
jgi:hypothetical protein